MDQVVAHIVRREQELSHPAQVVVPREVENRPPAALSAWFLYVFKQPSALSRSYHTSLTQTDPPPFF